MNTVSISGNIASDIRFFPAASGKQAMASFAIANSEYVNGENRDNGYFQVVVFGQQAANVNSFLRKGSRVLVSGRQHQRSWENEDGVRQYGIEIRAQVVAESLEFAHRTRGSDGGGSDALAAAQAVPPTEQPRDESGRFVKAS